MRGGGKIPLFSNECSNSSFIFIKYFMNIPLFNSLKITVISCSVYLIFAD